MSYTVELDFGSGWVDYTTLADGSPRLDGRNPITCYRAIHKNLKPVVSTCSFRLIRDKTLIGLFLASASGSIACRVKSGGAAYFLGTVRPTYELELGDMTAKALAVECVGPWYRLEKKIDFTAIWSSYKICDTSNKAASILHQLFYAAGFSDGELSLTTIDVTRDRAVFEAASGKTFREVIEKILEEHGYTAYDTEAGVITMYDLGPTSISTAGHDLTTGRNGNVSSGSKVKRVEASVEAVDVFYWPHETLSGVVVFEDTTGATGSKPCSIPLSGGEYYPEGAASGVSVDAQYKVPDRELIAVDSPAFDEDHTGSLAVQDSTAKGNAMSLRLYASGVAEITKLQITGDAIVKGNKHASKKENVVNTDKRERIECEWVDSETWADRLAALRANWHKYATYTYDVPKCTDLTIQPGDYYLVTDTDLVGMSQTVRIVSVLAGPDPASVKVSAEGVAAYSVVACTHESAKASAPTPAYLAREAADAGVKVWSQATAPTISSRPNAINGDIWYDSDDGCKYEAIGGVWVLQSSEIPMDPAGYWPFDEAPDIPDSVAGTTYLQDAWATTDSWGCSGGTLSVSGGVLRATKTGGLGNVVPYKNIATSPNAKTWRAMFRASKPVAIYFKYYNGSTFVTIKLLAATTQWAILDAYLASGASDNYIYIFATLDTDDWIEVDWIYVGTGAYTSPAPDATGNGNHGTINGPTPCAGVSSKALAFEINDYVSGTISPWTSSESKTLSCFLKIPSSATWDTTNVSILYGIGNYAGAFAICNSTTNNKIRACLRDSSATRSTGDVTITRDVWYHIVAVYNAATRTIKIYLNAVSSVSDSAAANAGEVMDTAISAGGYNGMVGTATFAAMMLDEAMHFNRALSAAEVLGLYKAKALPQRYTLGRWKVEQASVDSVITPAEKKSILAQWTAINGDGATTGSFWIAHARAVALGVSHATAEAARDALYAYLYTTPAILSTTYWLDNITIVGATYNALWSAYYGAEAALIDACAQADATSKATVYRIEPSIAGFSKVRAGTLTPSSVTLYAYSLLAGAKTAYAGRFKIYESDDGSTFSLAYTSSGNESSKAYTPTAGIVALKVELYLAGGTTTLLSTEYLYATYDGTVRPMYLGRYPYASRPTSGMIVGDWCTLYSETAGERGIYEATSATALAKQAAPTTEEIAAAWADICWIANEATDYGETTAYTGTGVNFIEVLGANIAFINQLFAQYIQIQTGGSIRGGTRYAEDGSLNDGTVPGFWIGASGACKVAGIEFEGSHGGGVRWYDVEEVHSPLSLATSKPAICRMKGPNTNPWFAIVDPTIGNLQARQFDIVWGAAYPVTPLACTASEPDICALGEHEIVLYDNDAQTLSVYHLGGLTWALTGSALTVTDAGVASICPLDATHIAFIDDVNLELRTYVWNGSAFSLDGNALDLSGTMTNPKIDTMTSVRIALCDASGTYAFEWDGTDWTQVGSAGALASPWFCAMSATDLALCTDYLYMYRFDGAAWTLVLKAYLPGGGPFITHGAGAVAMKNGGEFVMLNVADDELTTLRLLYSLSYPYLLDMIE